MASLCNFRMTLRRQIHTTPTSNAAVGAVNRTEMVRTPAELMNLLKIPTATDGRDPVVKIRRLVTARSICAGARTRSPTHDLSFGDVQQDTAGNRD